MPFPLEYCGTERGFASDLLALAVKHISNLIINFN